MSALENQARRIGARAAERMRERVAVALRDELTEAVSVDDDAVVVTGRGAVARMLREPALRWIAGLIR
ncbi:hypothetical protein FPZ54_16090 [Sphingomonas suaedae]|uniref:Uncharacterized protein n=1 Tax=Sphingomonas suaedae TaxID=2599297 RepID=A0A518RIU7_9SPHN|nr:hypothetical protein [Sphingomonas suaedae]QDX27375.1 hypothetical protein FPZ54_16090 [Sphingomonas suaedae]